MMNTYTVSVYKTIPALPQLAKHLLGFQLRTGFPIRKALELYKRPMTWEYGNKRDAERQARSFRKDGTGRTVTITVASR
jgi:hypothetical protein